MDSIGVRIKKLRKSLDLTQQEFASRIGTIANIVTNYETGRRNPSSSVINNICKTFNVSEKWLRTGEGEMFLPKPAAALDALAAEYSLSKSDYALVEKFLALKPEARKAMVDYMKQVVSAINAAEEEEASLAVPTLAVLPPVEQERNEASDKDRLLAIMQMDPADMTDEELVLYGKELRRQSILEKKEELGDSSSDTGQPRRA